MLDFWTFFIVHHSEKTPFRKVDLLPSSGGRVVFIYWSRADA